MNRSEFFAALRPAFPDSRFPPASIPIIDGVADKLGMTRLNNDPLTMRVLLETIEHEAIVREAYKDSVGVWTWSVGLTAAAGVDPLAYKDKPAPLSECLAAFVTRVRRKYLVEVQKAFAGRSLTEAQLAAALSFHWNTGAIGKADWVASWMAGNATVARKEFMNWSSPASIVPRRTKERDLFFDGKWAQTGMSTVYPVSKPSYSPAWGKAQRVNVTVDLALAMAA